MRIHSLSRICGFHLPVAVLLLAVFALASCEHRFELSIEPPAARAAFDAALAHEDGVSPLLADGEPVLPGIVSHHRREVLFSLALDGWKPVSIPAVSTSAFRQTAVTISLEPLMHELSIEVVNGESSILIDGAANAAFVAGRGQALLTHGRHRVSLVRDGYAEQTIEVQLDGPQSLRLKHQKEGGPARSIGVFPSGSQPKQVAFTPDNRYLVVPLLDDVGFDFISFEGALRGEASAYARIVGPDADKKGFVEPLILPDTGSLWISQMTTGMIHEYSLPSAVPGLPAFVRSVSARGSWTKVMASDPARRWIAVSNWLTNDVVILDRQTGDFVKKLINLAIPRGLAFSKDGAALFVASYDGDTLYRFSTETWKETKRFVRARAAMRHIVLSPDGASLFVNDMRNSMVFRLSTEDLSLEMQYRIKDWNPNTIDLDPAGKRLFVSCRGPNNPKSYLMRSPSNGHVYIIDVETGDVLQSLEGGNQPTGLDVSDDGRYLAFTNFLDNTVEVYALED